jgi:magnesium chelatase subunit D/magnesium chelatase subunit ChlD-like protein
MLQALELIRSWLREAMQAASFRRDPLTFVLVQGGGARLLTPPTTSLGFLLHKLKQVRVGGATPLDQGLIRTGKLLRQWGQRYPIIDVILVTDGRSTSPLQTRRVEGAAAVIRRNTRQVTVINPVPGSGEAAWRLAQMLKGRHVDVHEGVA